MRSFHRQAGLVLGSAILGLSLLACGGHNNPPVISAGSLAVNEDEAGGVEVLASDPDGHSLTVSITSSPAKGVASISAVAPYRLSYVPSANANGADSVELTATDSEGASTTLRINITVAAIPDPVSVATQGFDSDEDAQFNGRILANDPDGDPVLLSVVAPPAHGTLQLLNASTGDFQYTPTLNFNGHDAFTISASDGRFPPTAVQMTMLVRPVNDPPVASADAWVVPQSGTAALGVLANDTDADGDALTVTVVDQPPGASATVSGNQILLTPSAGAAGPTQMTYRVADSAGATATATVRLVIGSATPVFYAVGDTMQSAQVYRFDMFSVRHLDTPVPIGETFSGFATSANARRMIYITRQAGPPVRNRLWLKDLLDLNSPVVELATPPGFFANHVVMSPDGNHAIVNAEHIYLANPTQRQTIDSSVEKPVITNDSSAAYYAAQIGGGSRLIKKVAISASGVGAPQQMSATPGSAQGLGMMLGLSPDESLITSQGLYIDVSLGLQTHAYVTPANGSQADRRLSPTYSQSVDHAALPTVTFDNRFAFYSGTAGGVTGVFAADLLLPAEAQPIAAAPAGWSLSPALLGSDSRTIFFGQFPLNSLSPGTYYRGRLDQPGSVSVYAPAGSAAPDSLFMSPDGNSLVIRAGTNWSVARSPGFSSATSFYNAANSLGMLVFAPDSRTMSLAGSEGPNSLRIMNPLIPEWSVLLTTASQVQCVAWAGRRC